MFAAGGLARATINKAARGENVAGVGGAATFFVFLFTAIFGATWLTVPWLYPAEIFPLEVRARGNAWGVVGWSIGNGWTVSILLLPRSIHDLALTASSGASSPHHLQSTQREDTLPLRCRQRRDHRHRMGSLPRD